MHARLPLPGDIVWIRRRRWRVERARRDRHVVRVDVAARDCRLTFLSPFDRVFTRPRLPRPRRIRSQEAIARLAALFARAEDVRLPYTAVDAIADILPHQLEPVLAILAGRTRVLIADEVGLGKTVQAGLVIAELARRGLADRVLVIAPATLREQWSQELSGRFGIVTTAADRSGLDAAARAAAFGENPWSRSGVWIASPDFLKQRHVAGSLPDELWDLVVIDEAHAVCGDSDRYEVCHGVASRSRRVVLLTATPHAGDAARFARLVNLGRLDRESGLPVIFRRTRAVTGDRPPRRVRWHRVGLTDAEQRVLVTLFAFERAVLARSGASDQSLLLLTVFRKRALSTMSALSLSVGRRLEWLGEPAPHALDWLQPGLAFDEEGDRTDPDERLGLTAQSGLAGPQERSWLRRLRTLTAEAARDESKVERLAALLHRVDEPVVVFTEYRDSLDVIARRLRFSRPYSVLHGGQDAVERRAQLRRFLGGSTSVLLATDVAGQGLNLHARARWVVSLELPWNPARLEQRIGRVDRISQSRPTHLTLLVARDDAESGILEHLSRRVFAARRAFSADLLPDIVPPEHEIRSAVLMRTSIERASDIASPPLNRRWQRPARIVARALEQRRRLARAWRAADPPAGLCARADGGRAGRLIPAGATCLFVFSVPLLGNNDALVERRLLAFAATLESCTDEHIATCASRLQAAVHSMVAPRARALTRRVDAASDLIRTRELLIATALRDQIALEEVQPGLFDLRATRSHDRRVADADRIWTTTEVHAAERTPGLRHGDVILEMIITRGPR